MNAKEYLNRVFKLQQKLKSMHLRAEEYERLAASVPGQNYEAVRVDGTRSLEAPFVKWICKLSDLEAKIKETEAELEKVKAEVVATIEGLDDEREKDVLMLRYVSCMTWDEICEKLYLSERSAFRFHSEGLKKIKLAVVGS